MAENEASYKTDKVSGTNEHNIDLPVGDKGKCLSDSIQCTERAAEGKSHELLVQRLRLKTDEMKTNIFEQLHDVEYMTKYQIDLAMSILENFLSGVRTDVKSVEDMLDTIYKINHFITKTISKLSSSAKSKLIPKNAGPEILEEAFISLKYLTDTGEPDVNIWRDSLVKKGIMPEAALAKAIADNMASGKLPIAQAESIAFRKYNIGEKYVGALPIEIVTNYYVDNEYLKMWMEGFTYKDMDNMVSFLLHSNDESTLTNEVFASTSGNISDNDRLQASFFNGSEKAIRDILAIPTPKGINNLIYGAMHLDKIPQVLAGMFFVFLNKLNSKQQDAVIAEMINPINLLSMLGRFSSLMKGVALLRRSGVVKVVEVLEEAEKISEVVRPVDRMAQTSDLGSLSGKSDI